MAFFITAATCYKNYARNYLCKYHAYDMCKSAVLLLARATLSLNENCEAREREREKQPSVKLSKNSIESGGTTKTLYGIPSNRPCVRKFFIVCVMRSKNIVKHRIRNSMRAPHRIFPSNSHIMGSVLEKLLYR